jgi:hypothetical protein
MCLYIFILGGMSLCQYPLISLGIMDLLALTRLLTRLPKSDWMRRIATNRGASIGLGADHGSALTLVKPLSRPRKVSLTTQNARLKSCPRNTTLVLNRLQSAAPLEFSVEPDVRRGAARMGRSFERDAMYENAFNKIEQKLRTEEGIANELYYVGLVAV